MSNTDTIELLHATLDKYSYDNVTRSVLSDLIGEEDPVAAEALRWMSKFRMHAFGYYDIAQGQFFTWFEISYFKTGSPKYVWATLPKNLFDLLPADLSFHRTDVFAKYRNRRIAESALIESYRSLNEHERLKLWKDQVLRPLSNFEASKRDVVCCPE